MDKSKEGSFRRRRVVWAPAFDFLEGRRLMAANPAGINVGEGTVGGTAALIIMGTNKADVVNIIDNGTGAAGNITVTFGNGSTYTSQAAVAVIQVQTKGGNDRVSYSLTGDLLATRTVQIDLGAGNDRFVANLNGGIYNPEGLDLEAFGRAGNDTLSVYQTGPTASGTVFAYLEGNEGNDTLAYAGNGDIAAGASVTPALSGGAGRDTIAAGYSGRIDGNYIYNLAIDGGPGNDDITNYVNVGPGSKGTVGTSSANPAVVNGGAGNDQISYAVVLDPTATKAQVNAFAMGGAGKDTIRRTSNITDSASNEKISLIG